jgi:uncharacterized protein YdeI (YjbR/CyaY-like superfamily)
MNAKKTGKARPARRTTRVKTALEKPERVSAKKTTKKVAKEAAKPTAKSTSNPAAKSDAKPMNKPKTAAATAAAKTAIVKKKAIASKAAPSKIDPIKTAAWEVWLAANAGATGVWLKIAKKTSGIPTVTYEQALDTALCNGWIDGQKRGYDDAFFLQRFTPRRLKSLWSKINIGHVERLIAAGRMRAGGLREVEAAKADGRWAAAYDGASRMEVPEALALALTKNKAAAAFFEALDKTNRYAVCWRAGKRSMPDPVRAP